MGADVTVLELNAKQHPLGTETIARTVHEADLVIGPAHPGAAAPKLVPEALVKEMSAGSVVVDVSVDQGGCIETCRPTTHDRPTYEKHAVIHYCVRVRNR